MTENQNQQKCESINACGNRRLSKSDLGSTELSQVCYKDGISALSKGPRLGTLNRYRIHSDCRQLLLAQHGAFAGC
jgi:hypothetical protein